MTHEQVGEEAPATSSTDDYFLLVCVCVCVCVWQWHGKWHYCNASLHAGNFTTFTHYIRFALQVQQYGILAAVFSGGDRTTAIMCNF